MRGLIVNNRIIDVEPKHKIPPNAFDQSLLNEALNHPAWVSHNKGDVYFMDGRAERWVIVYYPIFEDGSSNTPYDEPRALVCNIDKPGFWSKETPLRYLEKSPPTER